MPMDEVAFGRYRLLSLIGAGGMGRVYRAHDTMIGRDVAVKVLPPELGAEPGYRARFKREAHAAARLNEPHIIPIYDTGEIDGQLYLVMPIVDGIDVHELLRREGPMSPQRAVHVIEQLGAALDAAHTVGLVHRDVKPSNALVTARDFVYLIDFGIAHDGAATKLTSTGMMVGTLAYMAPERFSAGVADARSDVYALACVLHECLTAHQPFPGDSLEQQIAAHLTLDPPRPTERRADLPAGLDDVIARGMAKSPEQRYQSGHELADAARHALSSASSPIPLSRLTATRPAPAASPPVASTLTSTRRVAPEPARRTVATGRPGWWIAAVVVVILAVVSVAVLTTLLLRHPSGSQTPTAAPSSGPITQPAPAAGQTAQPAPASTHTTPPVQASTPYVKLPGLAGCMVATENVVCQGNWPQAPVTPCAQCREPMHMDQVLVDTNGTLTWRDANIGSPNSPGGPGWFVLNAGQPYHGYGWTAESDGGGHVTFKNDATGHGMTITAVATGDSSHGEIKAF
ncbi:hypothetical protein A5791_17695 [Mycobacterium sp. 852002-51163_SCH5372311]|nr:hypothetical protein A5791_17695 [Mycobacterium sp. 852002-51163_SCH5372311]